MPEKQVITALTGTAAPLLTVDVSITEELDFSSIFLPRSWKKCVPYVTDVHVLDPHTNTQLQTLSGTGLTFELAKVAALVDDVFLEVELPPHQITPAGAPVSYVDWLGLSFWRECKMDYNGNTVYNLHPMDEYLRIRKTLGVERLDSMERRCYGDRTTAQLQTLFQNGTGTTRLTVPLYFPFGDDPMQAIPIVDLSQRLRWHFEMRMLKDLIHNTQNATVTPLGTYNFKMVFNLVQVTGDETKFFIGLSEEATGITYMVHGYQNDRRDGYAVAAGSNQKIYHHLPSMSRPLVYLNWCLIPTNLINDSGTNDLFFFNPNPPNPVPAGMNAYLPIEHWGIESNGQIIQRKVTRDYTTFYNYDRYNKGFSGEDQFDQFYAYYPHAVNAATGYLDYANLSNPKLEIHLGALGTGVDPNNNALPQKLTLIVTGKDYNFWFIKGGNITRCFN